MSLDTYLDDDSASALRFADPGTYEVVTVQAGDVSANFTGPMLCSYYD